MNFTEDLQGFIRGISGNIEISFPIPDASDAMLVRFPERGVSLISVPVPQESLRGDIFAARLRADAILSFASMLRNTSETMTVFEDRWHSDKEAVMQRIAAHLGYFKAAMARNCRICRISREQADDFLERHHSHGKCTSKFRYGLFAERISSRERDCGIQPGQLLAVSTFSGARVWNKPEGTVRSYEWIRYCSLDGMRIIGGMGKMLRHFIDEISPDDIMSYADLEWSDGATYTRLGFMREADIPPQEYLVKASQRLPIKRLSQEQVKETLSLERDSYLICNLGSRKFRLKPTASQSPLPTEPQKYCQ